MAFDDDDDNPTRAAAQPNTEDDDAQDRAPDFSLLASMHNKKGLPAQAVRKGEKDFEAHGTQTQDAALESSRRTMEEILSYQRYFTAENWVRAWYFPNWWVSPSGRAIHEGNKRVDTVELLLKDRVTIVEHDKGFPARLLGRTIPGVKGTKPASGRTWLLPEETLFLVERGTMELWWPWRQLGQLFPPTALESGVEGELPISQLTPIHDTEYQIGVPITLQGAYALLIGEPGERGKVPLARFQVYSTLKRAGYHVMPAEASHRPASSVSTTRMLWQWLTSLAPSAPSLSRRAPAFGPLVRPGLYRSYNDIFKRLAIIPRHRPTLQSTNLAPEPEDPFRVHYHVWKVQGTFTKAQLPPPDFRICVVDARETPFPTLEQISALLDSSPYEPPAPSEPGKPGAPMNLGHVHRRLKHGYRNVIVAVVDHGITSFNRFCDAGFAEEVLFEGFDQRLRMTTGGKNFGGKKGRASGRGGRAGRAGKRGGRRGGKAR